MGNIQSYQFWIVESSSELMCTNFWVTTGEGHTTTCVHEVRATFNNPKSMQLDRGCVSSPVMTQKFEALWTLSDASTRSGCWRTFLFQDDIGHLKLAPLHNQPGGTWCVYMLSTSGLSGPWKPTVWITRMWNTGIHASDLFFARFQFFAGFWTKSTKIFTRFQPAEFLTFFFWSFSTSFGRFKLDFDHFWSSKIFHAGLPGKSRRVEFWKGNCKTFPNVKYLTLIHTGV